MTNKHNPYASPNAEISSNTSHVNQGPEGIGGWLILLAIGIVFSPIRIIAQIFPTYFTIFSDGSWAILTTPGSATYHPLWKPILISEIIANVCFVILWIVIAFLFFSKKEKFKRLFIIAILATAVFQVLDAWAITFVIPTTNIFDKESMVELIRTLIYGAIWISYLHRSKRVKATFIR